MSAKGYAKAYLLGMGAAAVALVLALIRARHPGSSPYLVMGFLTSINLSLILCLVRKSS